mmetsp:Transcript_6839/g.18572  ORF Transcript_6839/g.18572 Transcript_6839/m.18572 type:complete len:128 (-) Transcript_6839:85-468(-)
MGILEKEQPEAAAAGDYTLCFHVPPFNSVDHLHLHVLAPASRMSLYSRIVRYNCWAGWCTSIQHVVGRLMAGKSPVNNRGRRPKKTLLTSSSPLTSATTETEKSCLSELTPQLSAAASDEVDTDIEE